MKKKAKYEWYTKDCTVEDIDAQLNAFERQGWEIFNVFQLVGHDHTRFCIVVVRPIPKKSVNGK